MSDYVAGKNGMLYQRACECCFPEWPRDEAVVVCGAHINELGRLLKERTATRDMEASNG